MDGSLHIYIIITSIVIYVVIIFLLRVLLLLLYDDYYYEYYRFSRRKAPIIIGLGSSISFSPQPFLPLPFILLTLSLSTAGFIAAPRTPLRLCCLYSPLRPSLSLLSLSLPCYPLLPPYPLLPLSSHSLSA